MAGPHARAEYREVERRAKRDEEEQKQEVAQGGEPRGDRLAKRGGGQRNARQQPAQLLAEAEVMASRRQKCGPADGEGHQQFRGPRQPLDQRIGGIANEDDDEGQHRHPEADDTQDIDDRALPLCRRADADGREHDHRQHHDDILHDQEAQRDPAMQRVDLALVRQKFHDDDRGGKRERYGHVDRGARIEPERQRDQESENRREDDLTQPRHQRHGAKRADEVEVEFQAHEEQQHGDAEFRQKVRSGHQSARCSAPRGPR